MQVKFNESTFFGGKLYRRGEKHIIEKEAAAALGKSITVLKEDKAVKEPKVDKMVKSPEVAKTEVTE